MALFYSGTTTPKRVYKIGSGSGINSFDIKDILKTLKKPQSKFAKLTNENFIIEPAVNGGNWGCGAGSTHAVGGHKYYSGGSGGAAGASTTFTYSYNANSGILSVRAIASASIDWTRQGFDVPQPRPDQIDNEGHSNSASRSIDYNLYLII